MADFPAIEPTNRDWDFGVFAYSRADSLAGSVVRFNHSSVARSQLLTLTFANLLDAEASLIRSHYAGQEGSYRSFELPAIIFRGHGGPHDVAPAASRWTYTDPPEEESLQGGIFNIAVTLKASAAVADVAATGFSLTTTASFAGGEVVGVTPGYRYWRFDELTMTGTVIEVGDWALVDGTTYVSGEVWDNNNFLYDTPNGSDTRTAMVDGVLNVRCFQLVHPPSTGTFTYDAGSAINPTGWMYNTWFQPSSRYITGIRVSVSSDGVTFTPLATFSGLASSSSTDRRFFYW